MRYKLFDGIYILNIIFQAILSLLTPAALLFFIAYILVDKCNFPDWSYAVALIIGILSGLVGMVKFLISATSALERLEDERGKSRLQKKRKENSNE